MKVLLTTDTVGGVWTYSVELARALRGVSSVSRGNAGLAGPGGWVWPSRKRPLPSISRDHGLETRATVGASSETLGKIQIALATMGAPLNEEQRRQLDELPYVTLFESSYKLEWMQDPWRDVVDAGRWLLDIERHFRPDVVHLNGYTHGSLDFSAPVLMVAHSCVLSWWQAVKSEAAPSEWSEYRRAVRNGLHAADLVVAPSAAMLESVDSLYGPLSQRRVIPNGRDTSLFHPAPKGRYVFSAGRIWDEAKNVAALTRVAPELSWDVYVAGDGGESLPPTVRWLGRLDPGQMADKLSHAAIYALPARYEPFGLSVLEAALSGCALVLGDIPSLRENWSGAACFVDPNDDDQLARTLNELISNRTLRESLAAAALARSCRFTLERFASGYLYAYRDLLSPIQSTQVPADLSIERIPACG